MELRREWVTRMEFASECAWQCMHLHLCGVCAMQSRMPMPANKSAVQHQVQWWCPMMLRVMLQRLLRPLTLAGH